MLHMAPVSVGIIGVGAMGAPIAKCIHQAGFQVTVCDRNTSVLDAFRDLPVGVTQRASDCASSDVVLVLVATAAQARAVILGDDGIVPAMPPGASPIVVVMSTIGPAEMTELKGLVPASVRLIDAPISGGILRAEQGTLAVLVGAEVADLDAVRPVLMSMATHVFHCGSVGAAQTVKLVNNVIAAANVLVSAEAYRLALDQGITLNDITPVLDASSGRNHLSQQPGAAQASYAGWTKTRNEFDSVTSIIRKDLGIAQGLASTSSTPMPFVATIASFLGSNGDDIFEAWKSVGHRRMP